MVALLAVSSPEMWRWVGEDLPGAAEPPTWVDGPLTPPWCTESPVRQLHEALPEAPCTKDSKRHGGLPAARVSLLRQVRSTERFCWDPKYCCCADLRGLIGVCGISAEANSHNRIPADRCILLTLSEAASTWTSETKQQPCQCTLNVLTKTEDVAGLREVRCKHHLWASPATRCKHHLWASPYRMADIGAAQSSRHQSRVAPICNFCGHVACKRNIKPRDVQM